MFRRLALAAGAGLLALGLALPGASANATHASTGRSAWAAHARLVRLQRELGYLPIGNDFARYERNVTGLRWRQ